MDLVNQQALSNSGIIVCEDKKLQIGVNIERGLLQAIRSSKIAIIIFSEGYAQSRPCLDQLSLIIELHKSNRQVVLPVFYNVDPSEIRYQTGNFGKEFEHLVQRTSPPSVQVSNWRTALAEAACLARYPVFGSNSRDESETVKAIVETVCDIILDKKDLFVAEHPVGVDSRVEEVITMLQNHQSEDVIMVGIWGMGGIGKSTIAKAIYNKIGSFFESRSYLSKVREVWDQEDGQVRLQNQLLFEICKTNKMNIYNIESGKIILRDRLGQKKALVVLDDVNQLEQLDSLCGSHKWFGRGSIIIITTRDSHLLDAYQVDDVYSVKLLSSHESLELFSRTTFKQANPDGEFIKLSRRVVSSTEGLTLALQVLGSFLRGRSPMEWESALRKLSTDLPSGICSKLKLSFDSLDGNETEIFQNIVLSYIGEDMNDVIQRLDARGCYASIGIRTLVDRSLITIDENNKLRMHNLLQLMGRQLICQTSQNELPNRGHRYEVFLSFSGEDTRATFTSHLYSSLCNAGIVVFKDDVELPRGNHIKTELLEAIGSSKISIIIFSSKYAGSKWCLEELSKIMELRKSNDRMVLPVFYDVDPSEIRNQTSSVGEALNDLIKEKTIPIDQVSKWRRALLEAGGIAGFVVLGSRDESQNVKDIVEKVCGMLNKKDLFVADHPVGVDSRVKEVITMLQNHQSEDVVMVGIWGMGGVGKTTVAKAIYNEMGPAFECRSYLSKIREVWGQEEGQVRLQNQLLSEICKTTKMKINSTEAGKITLSDRLRHKKALVVLDDVDGSAQLNTLVGSYDWFKPGSGIIITTRNQSLLHEMNCVVYPMKNLDEKESIQLFSWHTFKQESPKEDFTQLSRDIVAYSGGLPLALEVLGSYLFGKEAEEWKSVSEKLKKIPNDKIQKKLKLSFDDLDDLDKEIFLDITCFFIGMDRNDVTQILNGCGLFAVLGIKTLVERSLVTIDEKNILGMHDLLRDMGREIIREQSRNDQLGKRSRLWFHEDSHAVLLKNMGTEAIEGLSLELSQSEKMHFQVEAFEKMKRLRLLRLDNVELRGNYKYMSEDLRWLCWHGSSIKYMPSNFYQQKLVAINLTNSSLRRVWRETLVLERLKILKLSHSHYLVQTPDFSKLPNLEKLILKDCPRLSTIHHSIGLLQKLLLLDLEDCSGLLSLPRSIYGLKRLRTLILSGCVKIEKLEEDIEQMESLTTLIAPTIKQVPLSLMRLKSILHLYVCGHEGLSRHVIPSLFRSRMFPTTSPLALIPTHAGMPLSFLCNTLNNIHSPSTIPSIEPKQQSLLLEDGLEIPYFLCATTCMGIVSRLETFVGYLLIQIGKNSQVFQTLLEMVSQGLHHTNYTDYCILPDDNYPYWLTFKGEGTSVKFKMPPAVDGRNHLKGMTIHYCVDFPSIDLGNKACESCIICLTITNYSKTTTWIYTGDKLKSLQEAERKEIISNLESDDQVEVKAAFGNGFTVKKTAIYLIYKESFDKQMELSTYEATNLREPKANVSCRVL